MSDAAYRQPADLPSDEVDAVIDGPGATKPASGFRINRDARFLIVVGLALLILFLCFIFLIAFRPTSEAVVALGVVVAAMTAIVVVHYTVSVTLRQVADARSAAEAAEERAAAAESSLRESDAWAAQMESGLRVAVAKLGAAGVSTTDVQRAAGTPDGFF
ncbi:hypothetical protein [Agromyces seonyuensis]|uniref:Uncharacterized protein n=1 Tax=Agromyces seonyuensis TaxID=2662446 RepID=A0A6I4P4X1_9MICO|nr:hypothetical protein [Agromyces seonyuensis]MWB98414.1 hypothetical protein [Agromyces seonyuensis]